MTCQYPTPEQEKRGFTTWVHKSPTLTCDEMKEWLAGRLQSVETTEWVYGHVSEVPPPRTLVIDLCPPPKWGRSAVVALGDLTVQNAQFDGSTAHKFNGQVPFGD
jgi:hypothetical protein